MKLMFSTALLLCITSLQSNAIDLTPEQEIEQLIDTCIFDRNDQRTFCSFVEELLKLIDQHWDYFITKIPADVVDQMHNDFKKAKTTRSLSSVISILIKYKEYKYIISPLALKKFSTFTALRGLHFRLKLDLQPKDQKAILLI